MMIMVYSYFDEKYRLQKEEGKQMISEIRRVITDWNNDTIELREIMKGINIGAWDTFLLLAGIDYLRRKNELKLIKKGKITQGDVLKIL